MARVLTFLAQSRPAGTAAVSLFLPTQPQQPILKKILIANVSGGTAKYGLFIDNTGTTYDETTAIAWEIPLAAGANALIELDIPMNVSTGNFAIKTSVGSALNFTLIGEV